MNDFLTRDLGLELIRATERAASVAGRWMGLGDPVSADHAANQALYEILNSLEIDGTLVISEGKPGHNAPMAYGKKVGIGKGVKVDVVCDPIDGCLQLALGHPGALSVAAIAPAGSLWAPKPAAYMDKIVVNQDVASALVPECMDAPPAWTLALVARAKNKPINDLKIFILDRPRHKDLIREIRLTGARVILRQDGDIAGGLMACLPESQVDVLMGVGGVLEGLIVACAVKSLGGGMLGRLSPQSEDERLACLNAGLNCDQILNVDGLVSSTDVYFAATGITTGPMLKGIDYRGKRAATNSLLLRGRSRTMRKLYTEHQLNLLNSDELGFTL